MSSVLVGTHQSPVGGLRPHRDLGLTLALGLVSPTRIDTDSRARNASRVPTQEGSTCRDLWQASHSETGGPCRR